jgi:hypothetical protein
MEKLGRFTRTKANSRLCTKKFAPDLESQTRKTGASGGDCCGAAMVLLTSFVRPRKSS